MQVCARRWLIRITARRRWARADLSTQLPLLLPRDYREKGLSCAVRLDTLRAVNLTATPGERWRVTMTACSQTSLRSTPVLR
jgi:hypothetical protein